MATTQARSVPASSLPYYVWEVPEKSISIQLYFDVIDRMQPDIMRGMGALKRRGAEVGGILLGRSEPGPQRTVTVEDFESVPTEYLTGPSYHLSENDQVTFEAAIARHVSHDSGLTVVGFYRSHTRDGLYMDDLDLAVADRYFPDPGSVFLLVKPFVTRASAGGFFFREDGGINRDSSYLQFPFDRAELGGGETRRVRPAPRSDAERPLPPYTPPNAAQSPAADSEPAAERRSVLTAPRLSILGAPPDAPAHAPGRRRWRSWMLAPVFLIAAGVAGFFAYRELSLPKSPATPVTADAPAGIDTALPLKLSVAEKQNQLEVTWDRNAPAILQARRGVLSISDGSNKQDLELSGAQLRTGRVIYSRASPDVALRMEVFGEGPEPVTESIRIVSTEATPPAPERTPVASDPPVVPKRKPLPRVRPVPEPPGLPKAEDSPSQDVARQPEASPPEVELQRPPRRK